MRVPFFYSLLTGREMFPPAYPHDELKALYPDVYLLHGSIKMGPGMRMNRNMIVLKNKSDLILINPVRKTNGVRYCLKNQLNFIVFFLNTDHTLHFSQIQYLDQGQHQHYIITNNENAFINNYCVRGYNYYYHPYDNDM